MKFIGYFSSKSDVTSNDETVNEKDLTYSSNNHKTLGFPEHVVNKALKNAIMSREFEIQMYWKRASYFWLFVSALWVAFGKLLYDWGYLDGSFIHNLDKYSTLYQYSTLLVLSCAGLGLSVAWYFVNKGSKFWQENWEYQISFLENEIIGKSYKTVLSDRKIRDRYFFHQKWLGSFPYSVSKINVFIALTSAFLWLVSANLWVVKLSSKILNGKCCWFIEVIIFSGVSILLVYIFSSISKSTFKNHDKDDFDLVLGENHNKAKLDVHQRIY